MSRLPKRTKSQKIGVSGAELFNAVFSEFCNVIPVPQERDFGIDFTCEIMNHESPTGKLFNVQCKGTEQVIFNNNIMSLPIKVETLNYWLIQPNPTFLVIVDRQNCIFYWSFPKDFLNSLNKNWQEQKTVSIPVHIKNSINKESINLPSNLIEIIYREVSLVPKFGCYSKQISPKLSNSYPTKNDNILALMHYYLEGSRIANVRNAYGTPGATVDIYPETFGGLGHSKTVRARVWGNLNLYGEGAILLQIPDANNYVLSYETFNEMCFLLKYDYSDCEEIYVDRCGVAYPGAAIWVNSPTISTSAKAWYEISGGKLKLFRVQGKWYAISLNAPKTVSSRKKEYRTGNYLRYDPRKEILWHYFDLFDPNYSLPLAK